MKTPREPAHMRDDLEGEAREAELEARNRAIADFAMALSEALAAGRQPDIIEGVMLELAETERMEPIILALARWVCARQQGEDSVAPVRAKRELDHAWEEGMAAVAEAMYERGKRYV